MREKIFFLCEELSKSLRDGFSVVRGIFENEFQQVKIFYSTNLISRSQVRIGQIIKKG